jgi:RNA polymerase sigma-70 factor (ECF subfamily)
MVRMDLIERTLAGDPNSFKLIFDQYKNLVYRTAYLILDNSSEAEDALQETFLKVYRFLGKYQPSKGAFTTWLYRITVNHCLNQRRKLVRFMKPIETFDEKVHTSLEDKLSEEQALQQALKRLSNKLRVVIILRYFLDLSYSEIAQVLDIPLGTVKSRLNMGLKKVRSELKAEYPGTFPIREVSK